MFKAKYKDKTIYSFDILNMYNKKIIEIENEYRLSGRQGTLVCLDCGKPVRLKSGEVKVPHFAHVAHVSNCVSEKRKPFESEDHKRGIQHLFNFFREVGIYDFIDIDHRFEFKRRANIYVEGTKKLAIEYVANPMGISEWQEKNIAYNNNDISVMWVLSRKNFEEMTNKDYNFFEITASLASNQGIIFTLDVETVQITFAKYMIYLVDSEIYSRDVFKRTYLLSQMSLTIENEFSTDNFLDEYNFAYEKFCKQISIKLEDRRKSELETKVKLEKLKEIRRIKEEEKRAKLQENIEKNLNSNAECENRSSFLSDGKWGTCIKCGKHTNQWRAYLGDGKIICYCNEQK